MGAVSKMHKPASDRRKKNDRNDAEFLARQLMAHNIVEVFVPDVETEGARNLSRALEDVRDDLTRAKHRLTHLLIRWGYVWNEFNEDGTYNVGDQVTIEYKEGEKSNTVLSLTEVKTIQ